MIGPLQSAPAGAPFRAMAQIEAGQLEVVGQPASFADIRFTDDIVAKAEQFSDAR